MLGKLTLVVALMTMFSTPLRPQTSTPPARTEDNLIIASYNIKWIGQQDHDFDKLAQVIQHFDVCGIIEVKNESAIAKLVAALESTTGKDRGYGFGVRTHRPHGNYHEAYAVVWRKDRVELGDGITSNIWDREEAFRNDPYVVSFKRRNFDFTLILVHTRWSDDSDGTRENEVVAVAEQISFLRSFLSERDLIVAGDFNYPGTAEPMEDMTLAADLVQLDSNPKSTFKAGFSDYASSCDNIYVPGVDTAEREFIAGFCNTLDSTMLVYGSKSVANMKKSQKELSDHLPVFAVFNVSLAHDDGQDN